MTPTINSPLATMFSNLLFYWGFTPLSTLFHLYHGDSSLIHDPWVNKPVPGYKMCLAQGHSTMTVVPWLGIEPGTLGFKSLTLTTADSWILTFKPYVVCTQKNYLSERILLSTHNIAFCWATREIFVGKRPIHYLLSCCRCVKMHL